MNDKRILKNRYKQGFVPMGVFAIRNEFNQRVLLAESSNLDGAMNRHRFELTMRTHRNKALQADWLAHGAQAFSFEAQGLLDCPHQPAWRRRQTESATQRRIEQSEKPDFDYAAELAILVQIWRDELAVPAALSYNQPPARGPKPGNAGD